MSNKNFEKCLAPSVRNQLMEEMPSPASINTLYREFRKQVSTYRNQYKKFLKDKEAEEEPKEPEIPSVLKEYNMCLSKLKTNDSFLRKELNAWGRSSEHKFTAIKDGEESISLMMFQKSFHGKKNALIKKEHYTALYETFRKFYEEGKTSSPVVAPRRRVSRMSFNQTARNVMCALSQVDPAWKSRVSIVGCSSKEQEDRVRASLGL